MNYLKLILKVSDDYQEYLIAELMDMDFYGFEQLDEQLIAYVEKPRFNDTNREVIEQMVASLPGASFVELSDLAEENWNAVWEESIQPQIIGSFYVRPTWSVEQPPEGKTVLEIDPKMSFGTGYHATTRLMLRQLDHVNCEGKRVLDAGTGTGILAIVACKRGASRVIGFDFDPLCERNANENALINDVGSRLEIRLGGFEQVDDEDLFDLILANINRNVILEFLGDMIKKLTPDGILSLSGLLNTDEGRMREELEKYPVQITGLEKEEEWIMLQIEKTN